MEDDLKINLIGCDTIVNSPSLVSCESQESSHQKSQECFHEKSQGSSYEKSRERLNNTTEDENKLFDDSDYSYLEGYDQVE